jgi:hypothetical protein
MVTLQMKLTCRADLIATNVIAALQRCKRVEEMERREGGGMEVG